ncbi:HSPB1-associated protein 1-like [Branchiostoma floridae]|uniref:HSPB1-associated protein 1-like n=1 Tax=Branchiostoma floridae TaxID=7739 RepID=A0A9J7MYJ3_BRAFL|nr:HSPB1-associated protein 1-like [Branchiostoma floridae]
MASTDKQFSREEAHFLLMHGNLPSPAVFKGMVEDWPALKWSPARLAQVLENRTLRFRTGPRNPASKDVLWETDCEYIDATLQQFCEWLDPVSSPAPREECVTDNKENSNPFQPYHPAHTWAYLDYKYMAEVFCDQPDILQGVRWEDFGFPGRTGTESTIWVGSAGAHTPCHYDTYGCNLVLQVYGRKKWVLFPPEDSANLYPTRLPYEESSVFSQVNVAHPDIQQHPKLMSSHPHVVILEPGDVLFVPKHWWHYVESLSTSVAVNSWIEMASDAEDRLQEAVVRLVLLSIKSDADQSPWLNPTENVTSRASNLGYLQAALEELRARNGPGSTGASNCTFAGGCPFPQEDTKTTPPPSKRSKLEDSNTRTEASDRTNSYSTPSSWFGPNLVPVLPCKDYITDKLCSMQASDVTADKLSQERTSVAVRPADSSAAAKHTAVQHTAEMTAGESMTTKRREVAKTAEQTTAKQTPDEHMSSSAKVKACLEGSESADMSRSMEQDRGLRELESTIVNCLVQPHVVQEVAKLLKERLRLS